MRWLIALSVRRRGVVAILAVAFLVLGSWSALKTPIDVFPEFVPAQVSIQTEAPGLTPDQVETLITRPIEAAVNGAPALAALRSESIPGLSVVSLDFGAGADAQRAHQDVAERLARVAASLPAGSGAPKLSPLTSSTMDVLKVGLVSDRLDRFALRDLADWNLKPLLLGGAGRRTRQRVRRRRAADSDRARHREARGVRARARRSRRGRARRARAARHGVRRPRGAAGADRLAAARAGRRGARARGPHRAQRRAAHDRRFRERHDRRRAARRRHARAGPRRRVAHDLEPVRREYDGRDARARRRARGHRPATRGRRHHGVSRAAPPGELHRARARQSARRLGVGGRARARRVVRVPARRARRADFVHDDPVVARRGDARAAAGSGSRSTR